MLKHSPYCCIFELQNFKHWNMGNDNDYEKNLAGHPNFNLSRFIAVKINVLIMSS